MARALTYKKAEQALTFVMANKAVCVVIPGMTNIREVEENARVGENFQAMTEAEKQRLIRDAEVLGKEFCRGCGYCQPCQKEIRIPLILRQLNYRKQYGLADWARGRYRMVEVKADECTECGQSRGKCTYDLDVPELLKKAHEILS